MVWNGRVRAPTWLAMVVMMLVPGCISGADVADVANRSPQPAKPAEPTMSEQEDRERQDLTTMEATAVWVHPGAFKDVRDGEAECGFRLEVWSDHHGFRFESDPHRDHRSLEKIHFDDGRTGTPFTLMRGPMGVFLFLGPEASPQQDGPGVDASPGVTWFLRTLTTASDDQIAQWARTARMSGHVQLWQDPAWEGWADYGTHGPTPTGGPPGAPPASLFRVEDVYLELTGGVARPLDDDFGEDVEVLGNWTFTFNEDRVTAVRSVAAAREIVLVSPKEQVRYLRAGQVGLDDDALRDEVTSSFACLGLAPPDLDGLQFQRWPLPMRHEE